MEKNIFTNESRIVTRTGVYFIKLYNEKDTYFSEDTAYLKGDQFYIYNGETSIDPTKPGIWFDTRIDKYILVEADPDDEEYRWENKVGTLNPDEIVNMINNKEVVIVNFPDSEGSAIPEIKDNDDILKRLIKEALQKKQINIDLYKSRFVDKNALFNFKQVIKGDGRVSMLLFDRGMDAFNLKYTIIIEEADPDNLIIGLPLTAGISASSADTHTL